MNLYTLIKILVIMAVNLFCIQTVNAESPITVEVVWPFNAGSPTANLTRAVIESANKDQQKYLFVFVSKPGAGGAVGTNYVGMHSPSLRVLSQSTSFWSRPRFFKEGAYDVNKFIPLSFHCLDNPLTLVSARYTTLNELLSKNKNISIGITPGSITSMIPAIIGKHHADLDLNIIPYLGSPEATLAVLGGHIDAGVDFIGPAQLQPNLHILAVTGVTPIGNIPTFASLGISGLEYISNAYLMLLPVTADPTVVKDLVGIFSNSAKSELVRATCTHLPGKPYTGSNNDTHLLFNKTTNLWKNMDIK